MAVGGTSRSSRKAYARQIHNVLVTQKTDKKPRLDDLPITFTEEDARKVFHPYDNALVVTLEIAGYSIRRTSVYPLGVISLHITTGTYPKQATKKVDFLVVDCPSAYNVIIGRPTLNRLRAVTSTYHLLVRFPIKNGIGEMRGDQAMARECYLTSINIEQVHQTLIMEERKNIAEPTEELEEIVLIEDDKKKTTRIGTSMTKEIRDSIVRFLKENADVFAWSHDDMPGISTEVLAHKLNVNPSMSPVKQKRRVFAPERNAAVMEEVDKLLTVGFIREVYYPEWLANVVMVKKSTGKWRMCVDFTDLNKACPKDTYPLPRIDQLVDSTAGHKLLSFMDAFSGYNQIQMTEEDQEKTAFITRRNVEVYVDDMLVKSKKDEDHLVNLKETFQALRRYNMKLNPAKYVFGVSSDKFLGFMVSQREIEANLDKIKAILEMSPLKTVKEVQSLKGKAAALNSSVLIREEERIQKLVYYTSRALRGAEERYSNMEKLAFALLIASRKLRPYFQTHSIIVLTDYPLRKAMNKPDAAGRLEFTHPWKEDEQSEEDEAWTVNIDRSSTKEMSGVRVILVSPEKDKFEYALQLRFRATQRSGLIVGQVKGEYEAKEDRMKKYLTVVKDLLTHFKKVELLQIPREENVAADRLAMLASSGVEIEGFIEIQGRPSTEEGIVNSITDNTTWMSPIIRYLREGKLPADRTKAHKLRIRASHFRLLGGTLYKMGFSRPHLRCLSPEEANYVIREVHEGVCGNHSGARALAHKLTRIKTRLEGAKSMWVEELPSVLWAYRTTVRTPTKETPFKLTFGTEAVIPVEIGLTTLRTTFHKEEENEGQLHLNLDLLDETREKAARRIALFQGKMARYYNTKVKLRRFEVGDWVLRKVTQEPKDPSQGKLGPNLEGPYKIIQYYRRGTYHLEDHHGKKLPHPWNAEHLKKYYS
uniref:Reverse transcriptase RNase H-like domain-containing protein n=1 Tax=Fagus sylvatica TaxID=28930 RepID=A0A2N9EWT7_FAGSY